jgi:ankyrin repeat protein
MNDPITAFIEAALWHGPLEPAEAILKAHPEIAGSNIHTAAILGDDAAIRGFLAADPQNAFSKAAPYNADALTCLCFSKYLQRNKARSDSFLRAATALLDAGADPNTGFWNKGEYPGFEAALYGAAGVAFHAGLTRLLLERGADPNDCETFYHAPESYDNAALKVLVESGRMSADNLAAMLLRKADRHDHEGIKYLLEHGVEPNRMTRWGYTALHQALRRDNHLNNIELMLAHGADPAIKTAAEGRSGISIAARRGRGDVLEALERRGVPIELDGVERLIAACARNEARAVRAMAAAAPGLAQELLAEGGRLLAEFAGTGNAEGVGLLLDLGVSVGALYDGDPYFDIANDSTALHVAAWKAWPGTVKLLAGRGAPVNALDGKGRTPLALAVRACVDSYWTARRSPESVEALLRAGASASGIKLPSGYAEVDELLSGNRSQ